MKASELRNKSVIELKDEMLGLLREQFNLRTQRGLGQSSQTHQFKNIRKSIARIKTILGVKEGLQL